MLLAPGLAPCYNWQMIYTVGYAALTPESLGDVMASLDIHLLVDCRSVPNSRRPGFSRSVLKGRHNRHYEWAGDRLGGRGNGPTPEGLEWLTSLDNNAMLLCLETAPGECHRHHTIAVPLLTRGIDCLHVYREEIVAASELQRSIDADDNYDWTPFPSKA